MKPSERRALEEEKRAQREAVAREAELEKASHINDNGNTLRRAESSYSDEEQKDDGYHRESFFSSHVRLITFIICMALILTVLGPWGIDMLVQQRRTEIFGEEVENKKNISADAVILLSDMGYDMTWDSLAAFSYTDFSTNDSFIREYEVADTGLVLRVGGKTLKGSPEYVRLINYRSGEFIEDIRKEGVRDFIWDNTN